MRWGIPLALLALLVVVTIFINQVERVPLVVREGQTFEKGIVTEILQDNLQPDGSRTGEQVVMVHMTTRCAGRSGDADDQQLRLSLWRGVHGGNEGGGPAERGGRVHHYHRICAGPGRSDLSVCRALSVGALPGGGKQGIKGALGLVFTFLCILFVYLPLVYRGFSPFWVAVLVCVVTTVVTLYLIGGPTKKTLVAAGGTIAGVIIAGVAATLFSMASGISGWNVSDIESLLTLWNVADIQVGGLLFSGLLISSLGAVMDVAMSIGSAIGEIHAQNPAISSRDLFRAGIHVGRDMMGTDSNTLILAFAGGSVSMLLLDYAYDLPYLQIINSNNIGIAIMQGLSGSFGIVLAVPITVLLAVAAYTGGGARAEGKHEE